jgi:FdrA protein
VLGYGSHPDPAGALVGSIASASQEALRSGRFLAVVASVCGTQADPQNLAEQEAKLRGVGVLVAPSNAQAARTAVLIVAGSR